MEDQIITGSILANAVNAEEYENFTDVDAIYVASPKIVHKPLPIDVLSYTEMRELSYAGFSVFHTEALLPSIKKGIPVHVCSTNNPEASGTYNYEREGHFTKCYFWYCKFTRLRKYLREEILDEP